MPNITVYGGAMGTSFRVHLALHEMGLSYETRKLDFANGENRGEAFLKLNPMGQVPVIDVDGFVLPESVAITEYLARKFAPELLGKTPEDAASVMRWSIWNMLNLNAHFSTLASPSWTKQELAPEVKEKEIAGLNKRLPILEAQLAGKEWILGDFTLADINLRPTFMYGEFSGFDFSAYPNIAAWMKRCAERPAYLAAKG